jgi:hypothetical protein
MEYQGKTQFPDFLKNIIQPSELTIPSQYILPSEDVKLKKYALEGNFEYRSSTSSMSSVLSQLFLQISNQKPTNSYLVDSFKNFVKFFQLNLKNSKFAPSILKPAMITLNPTDGGKIFSVDAYTPPLIRGKF